jgi:hypothetical protein
MSKRFVLLVVVIAGCGVEGEIGGVGSDEPVGKVVSAITYGNGHDYFFFQSPKFWSEAQSLFCRDVGHLVTIGDAGENEFVRSQIAQHGGGTWWIGRNDQAAEAFWRWDSNEFLRFDNWFPGEPNNFNNEDCATIDAGTGKWNDVTCNAQFNFVCERDTAPAPATLSFAYSAANTNSDTQNFVVGFVDLVSRQGVTIGTCGLPGATSNGSDTYLRLFDPSNTIHLTSNDDACGGLGSNFSFSAPSDGRYVIRAGCFGSNSCSGTVKIRQEFQAPPGPH